MLRKVLKVEIVEMTHKPNIINSKALNFKL